MKSLRKQTGKRKSLYTEPDQFQSFSEKVMDYAKENTTRVIAAVGVVAVLFIAAAGFMLWRRNEKMNMAAQTAKALEYYDINSPTPGGKPMAGPERMQKARELFGKIAQEGGGDGADVALYYKANTEMEMGDLDSAIKDYKDVIAKASGDASLVTLARHRLGAAYFTKGDTPDAIETYKSEVATPNDYLKDAALYELARIYQQSGKTQEAMAEFNALKKDFPNSPYTGQAYAYISGGSGAPITFPTATVQTQPAPAPAQAAPAAAPAKTVPPATTKK